ncbi:uncharacterized protein E6C27_scaffold2484G00050 [Cucumis melo var. makuwa]|uniref:CCHC-type domain-containing protein n=1 Tax=Cucumis melo var. makuwa TaxID=1194695 RepID=A0A5A7VHF1_CUCMM|nr:uncharacterized protein E6C27_scaffold2484G00050 [Cucumis melo var. makuwa]
MFPTFSVKDELPVPNTLPTFAESFGSNSRSAEIVRGDDVYWLHAVFRAKTAGGPGGGVTTWYQSRVMPPHTSRRRRQNQDRMQDPTQGQSERGSSTPRGQNEAGSEQFARSTQEIGRPEKAGPSDPEKMRNDARMLDWQTFRGIFEEKYYPTTYCEAKRDEFLELKQGCRRFERGLRFEIRTPVTAIDKWMDFSQLVETALRVEQSIVEEKSAMELSCQDFKRQSGGKPLRQMSLGSTYQRPRQRASSQSANSVARSRTGQKSIASESSRTPCVSCGKIHRGQCLIGAGVCYQCGQTRHFKRNCPQLRVAVWRDQGVESHTVEQPRISITAGEGISGARQKGVFGRPRQQGKVYAMNQQEAEDAPDVNTEPLSEELVICTPVGDVLLVSKVLHDCEVVVEGLCMLVDLLPLELKPGSIEVVFRGERKIIPTSLISALKVEKLLRKGCTAFLAHVVKVQEEKLKPEDVVNEYLDAFPADLSGLPPDSEVEFTIEL